MLFTEQRIDFRILDVFKLNQTGVKTTDNNRHYAALSFRQHTDAVLISRKQNIKMTDGIISFIPPDLNYERTADVDEMIALNMEIYNYTSYEIEYFITTNYKKMNDKFEKLYETWSSAQFDRFYKSMSIAYDIFSDFYSECIKNATSMPNSLYTVIKFINENYQDPDLSIKDIANHISVSEVYLRLLFKQHFNTSPKQYLQDLRIKHAASLLTSGYYLVSEAAEKCGFNDTKYFSTAFKRLTGYNPSKYCYNINNLYNK